jgi:putative membrane protein
VLGIPILNFVAWFVIATAMMAVLGRVPARGYWVVDDAQRAAVRTADRVPFALYLWTYASSVLAHAAFFGLPGSALLGGVGMGIVVALLLRVLRR